MNEQAKLTSSGVEALIERLKSQGINAGQEKAEHIVLDAQKRAEWIINEATREARLLIENAKDESEAIKRAGQDALKLAARDAYMKLRDAITASFKREVMRLVGKKFAEKKFLEKLILSLAGQTRSKTGLDKNDHVIIKLPVGIDAADELHKDTEELLESDLDHFVRELSAGLLRKGVHLELSQELTSGLLVTLVDDDITIDFTEPSVAALLLEHLQPRFHDLLEGIVK